MTTELWAVGLVVLATLVGALGPILIKRGAHRVTMNIFSQLKNRSLIAGVGCYVLSSFIFVPALRGGELSVLYPLVSVSYVWVCLLSIKILGEKMGTMKWCGVGLIILGVSLIGLGS